MNDANYNKLKNSISDKIDQVDQQLIASGGSGILPGISEYAMGLTRVSYNNLFAYIATEMQKITGAGAVVVSEYDPQRKELICRHTTLNEKNNSWVTRTVGRAAVGMSVPVDSQLYRDIVDEQVREVDTLTESTFGRIPAKVSTMVKKVFGVNCYMGIALIFNRQLIGTLLIIGEREKMITEKELLKPFVSVTANAIELKEKELLLEQSHEWYRTIAEDIPALVVRLSIDYTVTYANDAYCKFFGLPAAEIIGSAVADYIPSEHYKRVIDHFKSLTPERPIASHEHANTAHGGREHWVRWTNRAIFDERGKLKEYLCIGEDITEQRNAFNLIQESEAMKRAIIEASPDVIFFQDSNGCFIDVISSGEKLLYLSRSEYIGRKLEDVLPLEVAEEIKDTINEAVASGELETMEFSIETPEGILEFESRIKASSKGTVTSFVRDITDKKRFERDLRESEEKYREILSSIEEGYYETDLSGIITFCNDAALRMIGYKRDELIGMSYRNLYRESEKVYATFNRVYLSGKPERGFTLEMLRKDGTPVYGELSVTLVRNRKGEVTGFRGLARDITERILFEKKLQYLSIHDQLTGLHNRAFYEEEMVRLGHSADYPITIITADLDDLKLVNDSLGHDAGDQLLKDAAIILKESVRNGDVLARVGGDEFSILLPATDEKTGELITARIRGKLNEYNLEHQGFPLGLSIGLATAANNRKALKDVFKQADDQMYHDKLSRSTRVRNKTVEALLAALAERDYITEGHTQRLSNLCRQIGEKINLSSRQLADLALLAQVHDLGKVGIPDNILFKNDTLTEEEWNTMRLHPEKGYRIALASPDLSGIADLILKHHEHWDGSGYPLGLKGEEIPIECRILAIVDSYDAITRNRPYSKAASKEVAFNEIKRCAGTQFDPELVDLFISLSKNKEDH